jgi:hypothetical protein
MCYHQAGGSVGDFEHSNTVRADATHPVLRNSCLGITARLPALHFRYLAPVASRTFGVHRFYVAMLIYGVAN